MEYMTNFTRSDSCTGGSSASGEPLSFCTYERNLFAHGALKSSQRTQLKVVVGSRLNWNLEMLIFVEGVKCSKQG